MKLKNLFKLGISVFAFFALVQSSFAIGISPARTELDLNPGESKEISVIVFNPTDKDVKAKAIIEFFLKNNPDGSPVFIKELEESDVHNIRNWIDVPKEPIIIPANNQVEVPVTINVPLAAEPGGKYATVIFEPMPETGEGQVRIIPRVAHLLLINVKGDVKLACELDDFSSPKEIYSDQPFNFNVTLNNTGNTHFKAQGSIEIVDSATGESLKGTSVYMDTALNREITSDVIPVNREGGNILPDSIRFFTNEWTDNIKSGKFLAKLKLTYAEGQPEITKDLDFEINESLNVDKFDINILPASSNFTLVITNTGNVIEKLAGFVSITNVFKYEVAKINLPADIEYIKPGETKTFTLEWLDTEMPKGLYKATLHGKLGLTDTDLKASVTFGKMSYTMYAVIGSMLLIILLLLFLLLRKKKKENKDEKKHIPHKTEEHEHKK